MQIIDYLLPEALILLSYLLGSVPFGIVAAKLTGGVDPRSQGSGNIGATNVSRTSGKAAGVITLACDVAKGALPTLAAVLMSYDPLTVSIVGGAAFVGHCFPIFLGFSGGKGVATACGVMAIIAPLATILSAAVFLFFVLISGYISVGSMTASMALPVILMMLPGGAEFVPVAVFISLIIIVKHGGNIKRIFTGTENRL